MRATSTHPVIGVGNDAQEEGHKGIARRFPRLGGCSPEEGGWFESITTTLRTVTSRPGEADGGALRTLLGSLPVEDWTEAQADAAITEIGERVAALATISDEAARVAEGGRIVQMIYEVGAHCQWSGIAGEGTA